MEDNSAGYDAFKNAVMQEETDKAVKTALQEKMDACLESIRKASNTEPFQCIADIHPDHVKIAETAQKRVESRQAHDQRLIERMPPAKWGSSAFFLFIMALALRDPIRKKIAAIKGPAPQ